MNDANTRNSNLVLIALALVFWIAGSAYVGINGVEWFMPDQQASAQAESIDNLFQFMLIIATFIFLMVETLLFYFAIRYGFMRDPQDTSDGPPIHGNNTLEILWTLVPSIIVFVLTIYSFQVLVDTTEAQDDEMAIQVTGQRFFWQFTYPDNDPDDSVDAITTNHTLVLPQNQNIVLELNSIDVIHAFWVPAFRVKNDVMPGRTSELRFTPTELTGLPADFELVTEADLDIPTEETVCPTPEAEAAPAEPVVEAAIPAEEVKEAPPVDDPKGYDLVCAELCGGNHGLMRGEVFVVTPDEYEAYIASLVALEKQQQAQQAFAIRCGGDAILEAGRELFGANGYNCVLCHQLADAGQNAMGAGPSMNGVGDRALTRPGYASGEDYILTSIINPNAYIVEGYVAGVMPQNFADQIPPEELDLLVAYLLLQTAEQ